MSKVFDKQKVKEVKKEIRIEAILACIAYLPAIILINSNLILGSIALALALAALFYLPVIEFISSKIKFFYPCILFMMGSTFLAGSLSIIFPDGNFDIVGAVLV